VLPKFKLYPTARTPLAGAPENVVKIERVEQQEHETKEKIVCSQVYSPDVNSMFMHQGILRAGPFWGAADGAVIRLSLALGLNRCWCAGGLSYLC